LRLPIPVNRSYHVLINRFWEKSMSNIGCRQARVVLAILVSLAACFASSALAKASSSFFTSMPATLLIFFASVTVRQPDAESGGGK